MLLSVIIVNYRVPYFLELCLRSVESSLRGLEAEVIVVDNHSADGATRWLQPRFPAVKWILNAENRGFSRANNQGLAIAAGKYILFLNPDTIVPEDFARLCLGFLQSTPEAGGLGVRMIDGSGRFLKESRRDLPTPWVAFCRLFGLSVLFPRSRRFSRYYLGYLPPDRTHPAAILSGACLWVSRAALDKAGVFDESFFLYAEDIDLSYRLGKAGFINYYFADSTIIHFKGESTQKDTRYIRRFYKAMSQFRRKHFNSGPRRFFGIALETGIWIRAGLSALAAPVTRLARRGRGPGSRLTGGSSTNKPAARRSPGEGGRPNRSFLTGDPVAIRQLQPHVTVAGESEADEIILCIGEAFSFKSAITALIDIGPGRTVAFFAAGATGVISSSGRDSNGNVRIVGSTSGS